MLILGTTYEDRQMMKFTKKDFVRYASITRQLAKLRARGWTKETHPDIEILEAELETLGNKIINSQKAA